ncbi:MAG: TolC family protein [Acidobacteriota bacterium]|nr:TolC family protein [Acidobacteriota bacterium]
MRIKFLRPAAALTLVALLLPCAPAQNPPAQDATTLLPPVRPFRLPARIGVFGEARITLQQALAMALANNKDITASRIDREIAGYNLTGARGLYDPTVGAVSQFLKQETPVASSLGGSATGAVLNRVWQTDPTVSGFTPWLGGNYHVDFSSQRVYTNNSFATLNPQYPSALVFQYTQPLLRNLLYDQNRHTIDVAKKNQSLSNEQFRQRVMQVVQQTEQAYWELFYAYNNLQVQLDSVDIARMQDESNRRQQEQGLLAPIDVVAAQTQLANFELNAYSAQTTLTQAENNLKSLMLEGRGSALWASALIPLTPPESTAPVTPLTDAVNQALADRPEIAQARINGEINQRDTRYYREQIKPQVDVIASYTRNGLAGPQVVQTGSNPLTASLGPLLDRLNTLSTSAGLDPVVLSAGSSTPGVLIGDYGQSLNNLWAGNFPTTQIQLKVSLPIRNRAAESNLSTSLAQSRRIQNQREQVEQAIEADVRNAMQLMQSAELRLQAARIQRESAEEQYNSEQRQFRAGTSTLFLVQQRQTTMISARSQERRAQSDLGEAISAFELSTASILRQHNINLQ